MAKGSYHAIVYCLTAEAVSRLLSMVDGISGLSKRGWLVFQQGDGSSCLLSLMGRKQLKTIGNVLRFWFVKSKRVSLPSIPEMSSRLPCLSLLFPQNIKLKATSGHWTYNDPQRCLILTSLHICSGSHVEWCLPVL